MTPLPAPTALDAYFLEARCRLLDIAAFLDRIDRGECEVSVTTDPRLAKIQRALQVLMNKPSQRAEAIQQIFSLDYDPTWTRPAPQ